MNDDVEEVCKDVDVVKEVNLKLIVAALQAMSRTSTDEISALQGKFCPSQEATPAYAGHTLKSGIEQKLCTPGFIAKLSRVHILVSIHKRVSYFLFCTMSNLCTW